MKTKKRYNACSFLALRVKKYFKYQAILVIIFVVFFIIPKAYSKNGKGLLINEIQYEDENSSSHDFIEIYNPTDENIDLGEFNLYKMTASGTKYSIKSPIAPAGTLLERGDFFVWASIADSKYPENVGADTWTSQTLADKNAVAIIKREDTSIVDSVSWGDIDCEEVSYCEKSKFSKIFSKKSIGRIQGEDTDDNEQDFFILKTASPGGENEKFIEDEKEETEKVEYPIGILFNELYPKPNKNSGEKEYVELLNSSTEKIALDGWKIVDYGKHECLLDGKNIDAEKLLFIEADPENKCVLELNDSGTETVWLRNPNGDDVIALKYSSAKEGKSYNYDGSRWRWSKFLTPGSENIFNNEPYGKTKIAENIFVNVYASFSVAARDEDGDKIKVTWDFGDGHKSYLAKTRHKYEKTGTYNVSVKLSDGSEDVIKSFAVEVKNFPHPKISIISIKANPLGNDSIGESIIIENKSKKKINLKDWSVATGIKNLVNHPINEDFVIEKNKSKELTRKFSSFSLNNKASKIEIRYPDGKVASKARYDHGKSSIGDDEIYQKIKGGWEWVLSQKSIKFVKSKKQKLESVLDVPVKNNAQQDIEFEEIPAEIIAPMEIRKENKILSFSNDLIKIELLKSEPRVLGAQTVREVYGQYLFTSEIVEPKHWAIVFLKNVSSSINTKINLLLNFFK